MEELPTKAKAVMGIYATATSFAQASAVFFGFGKEDVIVFAVAVLIAASVSAYVYITLYFRHYKYYLADDVIIIKKGALFKRRHLIYVRKISTITIHETFVHRWFGLCTVFFHVQGSVVKLSFIPVEKSVELQKILDYRD